VEVSPLGAPNRHSLGKLLPYQQADGAQATSLASCDFHLAMTLRITPPFGGLCSTKGMFLGITHPFAVGLNPLDLHVLGTPPAFILSQDQTLKIKLYTSMYLVADAASRSAPHSHRHSRCSFTKDVEEFVLTLLHTEVYSASGELAIVIFISELSTLEVLFHPVKCRKATLAVGKI
jgi:hypothetical protein